MPKSEWIARFRAIEEEMTAYRRWLKRAHEFGRARGERADAASRAATILSKYGEEAEFATERELMRLPGCGRHTASFIRRMLHEGPETRDCDDREIR